MDDAARGRRPSVDPRAPHAAPCVGSPPTDASARAWATRGRLGPRPSGRQLGAALAPAGGKDGASGPGPHPKTESVDSTAAPVARLERALAHGKAPYIVKLARPPAGMRAANKGRHSRGDLLTVRGRPKWVKPAILLPQRATRLSRRHAENSEFNVGKCHEWVAARRTALLPSRLVPLFVLSQTFFDTTPSVPPDATSTGSCGVSLAQPYRQCLRGIHAFVHRVWITMWKG